MQVYETDLMPIFRYGLFASISTILKTDMEKYMQEIIQHMMDSLQSTEGVLVSATLPLSAVTIVCFHFQSDF